MTRLMAERLVAVSLIIVAGFFLTESIGLPQRAGAFPQFAEYGIIVLALGMLVRTFVGKEQLRLKGRVTFDFSYTAWKPIYIMIVGIAYSFAIFEIGFYVSSFIFFFIGAYMTGLRNHKQIILTAVILFPLLYLFFTVALDAFLPEGILF